MLERNQMFPYQHKAVNFQCDKNWSSLWMDMGLGKTIVTLTSIAHLINSNFLNAVVIVAPVRVVSLVWRQEALKWSHTKHLTFSVMMGTKDQRTRALLTPANIYLINYENLKWLSEVLFTYFISKDRAIPFTGIVWDEISKMKNSTTLRVKSFLKISPHFIWATGLTGTPASNGYKDLHGQYLVLDKGERLGRFKTKFEHRFFQQIGYKKIPYSNTGEMIKDLIGDITLEMSAEDYNPLPELIINDIIVRMPPRVKTMYDAMEKDFFLRLENGIEVDLFNQAALINKCFQFSNGCVYITPGSHQWEPTHDEKILALEDIIEEANGKQVLCAYAYRSDAERIMTHFKKLNPVNLTDCKSEGALGSAMSRWKEGTCPLMIGHPASMGHGVDGLQDNGNIIVWFGLTYSLDLYAQMTARIRRQGQKEPVICHRILCEDTMDYVQVDALDSKALTQQDLRKCIKNYGLNKGYFNKGESNEENNEEI